MSRLIALLTDFGTTDHYVGVMKGVMLNINPDLQFVDLTQAIQPQNIKQAAFTLLNSYRYFPEGTIFLVVVDPGVGSARRPMATQAGDWSFVAPDNGVISYVLREIDNDVTAVLDNLDVRLQEIDYERESISNTFHGRDIFAPAAALLSLGVALDQLGYWLEQPIMLPEPVLVIEEHKIKGEVLHIDHFGNAVTSIGLLTWDSRDQLTLNPRFGGAPALSFQAATALPSLTACITAPIRHTYSESSPGEATVLVGSSGYLEFAINQGNFAAKYAAHIGDLVEIQLG